jgi:hypothetical protein
VGEPVKVGRVAGVLVLLVVMAIGANRPDLTTTPPTTGAGAPATSGGGPQALSWVLAAVGAAAVVLLIAASRWRRRRRNPEPLPEHVSLLCPSALERTVGVLVVALVISVPGLVAWWLFRAGLGSSGSGLTDRPVDPITGVTPPGPATGGGGVDPAILLVIGGAAAALVPVGLAWPRRKVRTTGTVPSRDGGLAEAVVAGRSALHLGDDDRQAVLACYAAMEQTLAEHGVTRGEADTPSEHLRRAVDAHLAPADAVGELLAVSHLARFSHHRISAEDRQVAERALGAVTALIEVAR